MHSLRIYKLADEFYKYAIKSDGHNIDFFLDFDETLATYWNGENDTMPKNIGEKCKLDHDAGYVIKRPYAEEFIKQLKEMGPIYI